MPACARHLRRGPHSSAGCTEGRRLGIFMMCTPLESGSARLASSAFCSACRADARGRCRYVAVGACGRVRVPEDEPRAAGVVCCGEQCLDSQTESGMCCKCCPRHCAGALASPRGPLLIVQLHAQVAPLRGQVQVRASHCPRSATYFCVKPMHGTCTTGALWTPRPPPPRSQSQGGGPCWRTPGHRQGPFDAF